MVGGIVVDWLWRHVGVRLNGKRVQNRVHGSVGVGPSRLERKASFGLVPGDMHLAIAFHHGNRLLERANRLLADAEAECTVQPTIPRSVAE